MCSYKTSSAASTEISCSNAKIQPKGPAVLARRRPLPARSLTGCHLNKVAALGSNIEEWRDIVAEQSVDYRGDE